jgi:hypothetical protein
MKKFSEHLAETRASAVKVLQEGEAPPVAAPAPAPVPAPAAAPANYFALLEEFGVKSVLDLDEQRFEEFHTKLVAVLSESA